MFIERETGNHDNNKRFSVAPRRYKGRRSLQRRSPMRATMQFLLVVLVLLARPANGGRWFQDRFNEMVAGPLIPATKHTMPALDNNEEPAPPLFVVGTNEGQVFTIDSADGSIVAGFSTGPPLLIIDDNVYENENTKEDDDEEDGDGNSSKHKSHNQVPADSGLSRSQIVPSWDGILYWRQPIPHSSSDGGDNTKLVPIAAIRDLVDNPIQLCEESDGTNCAILTATSLGPSLFSLNPQGSLNWARTRTSSSDAVTAPNFAAAHDDVGSDDYMSDAHEQEDTTEAPKNKSASRKSLVLQRQDYLVEQISTQTGEQIWNLTWGSLEALDFMGGATDSRNKDDTYAGFYSENLPEDPHRRHPQTESPPLPSLIFSNQGMSLVALLSQPPTFLWKRDFPSVVTIVLGMEGGKWQPLDLVSEEEAEDTFQGGSAGQKPPKRPSKPYLSPEQQNLHSGNKHHHQKSLPAYEHQGDSWYWWFAGHSGLGKNNPKAFDFELNEAPDSGGLVFVPRPGPQMLARNSWFLSHLFQSPPSKGEQSFQGYLDEKNQRAEYEKFFQQQLQAAQASTFQFDLEHGEAQKDRTNLPRLLLLPPPDYQAQSAAPNGGGVFLSWRVVTALVSVLVGSSGAAYLLYKKKKEKWLTQGKGVTTSERSNGETVATTTATTSTVKLRRRRSGSLDDAFERRNEEEMREHSYHVAGIREGSRHLQMSSLSFTPNQPTLNRSSSEPLIAALVTNSPSPEGRGRASISPIIAASHIKVAMTEALKIPQLNQAELVKHQSAPVGVEPTIQGGVGMIDGIPLIRYSRYQSEFREVEPLGKGGFGTVFRCCNVLDGREYAVKKVSIRSYGDFDSPGTEAFSQELHRVLREVKFLALLDDPHVVRYYTAWLEMIEGDNAGASGVNTSSLSRRYSSELLTSMDPSFTATSINVDPSVSYSHSRYSRRPSQKGSKKTSSNALRWTANNPLGWNNKFDNFDHSESSYHHGGPSTLLSEMEDCGFIFEESSEAEEKEQSTSLEESPAENRPKSSANLRSQSNSSQSISSAPSKSALDPNINKKALSFARDVNDTDVKSSAPPDNQRETKSVRHILYIQMQLCSAKTLADFLANKEARKGPTAAFGAKTAVVDIPHALRLFHQIVQAVKHVHEQGLIHRDLKPSNCFIDENGIVKVGDFGLSRESGANTTEDRISASLVLDEDLQDDVDGGDNTVGVGTRSYASPEQMNGSDYDSKTDVFSLGIMLFELCYPMFTGMERHICLQRLRSNRSFPDDWIRVVKKPFPSLHSLVYSMVSSNPAERPTADEVAKSIQSLLEEYTITLSIDDSHRGDDEDHMFFVRVEARPQPDVLRHTIQVIQDAASPHTVDVVQYGLRSSKNTTAPRNSDRKAILEFALTCSAVEGSELQSWASTLVSKIEEDEEILVARHVYHHIGQSY